MTWSLYLEFGMIYDGKSMSLSTVILFVMGVLSVYALSCMHSHIMEDSESVDDGKRK